MIKVNFDDLLNNSDLSEKIEQAFGRDGLGIILVSNIPGYSKARQQLLPFGRKLSSLPTDVLKKLEHPESKYNVGWSHGREKIGGGKLDILKGSFYANPIKDVPSENPELVRSFPDTLSPNIWPKDSLPEFEQAFKNLGKIIVYVGQYIGRQCDNYIKKQLHPMISPRMEIPPIIEPAVSSDTPRGRLLHYFKVDHKLMEKDDWCKWHKDHGALTGLTSAMFFDANSGQEIQNPDPNCGLWIRTSENMDIKIIIPPDCLAFQIGETSQILSHGLLKATLHCVSPINQPGITRTTYATFMQPNSDSCIDPIFSHENINSSIGVDRYKYPMTFGEFSQITVNQNY